MAHYRAVILSPHLDDAVFSCAGTIALLRKNGAVMVLNIFTRYLEDSKNAAVLLSATRYQEEEATAKTLNYEYKNLDELDAFFRLPKYRAIANIFKPLGKEDLDYLPRLKEQLHAELAKISFDHLYVPLAVGWHADHHLTFLSMIDSPYRAKILFYEDAPYCLIRHATRARLEHIDGKRLALPEFLNLWQQMSLSFYQSGMVQTMQPAWQRYFAFPVISYYLLRLLQRHARTHQGPVPINPVPVIIDMSAHADIKINAAALYASQVKEFFCDTMDMRTSYEQHAAASGHPGKHIERFWKFST